MTKSNKVLLIQGFLSSSSSLSFVKYVLELQGYDVRYSSMKYNRGFTMNNFFRIEDDIIKWYSEDELQVNIIGHSLGGMFARTLQNTLTKEVGKVIAVASPHQLENKDKAPTILSLLFTALSENLDFLNGISLLWTANRDNCLSLICNKDWVVKEDLCYRDDEDFVCFDKNHFSIIYSLEVVKTMSRYLGGEKV